jgi:hypothetical protein
MNAYVQSPLMPAPLPGAMSEKPGDRLAIWAVQGETRQRNPPSRRIDC